MAVQPTTLYLFKERMFYKAYNQNAMWFVQQIKAYKVTAKYIKTIQQEECFIGFPIKYLKQLYPRNLLHSKNQILYIYHPLIPKTSTVILYIAHLFICMKIIEENGSTLELDLIKLVLMNKIMCMLFCCFLRSITWSQKLYVGAGESLTMMPTAHVYAGTFSFTGTLIITDVTKAIGGAGLNWTDLHASRSTNKTNLKLNL